MFAAHVRFANAGEALARIASSIEGDSRLSTDAKRLANECMLGARFLLEEARARLDLRGPDDGAAFLAGYGAATGERWNAYRSALEAFVSANGRRLAILDAARATFEAFIRAAAVVTF